MHDDFDTFKQEFDKNPYHQWLNVQVLERSPGHGKIALKKTDTTPGGIGGSVHGGILASLVDIAMLVAIFADKKESEIPAGTAELSITYLRQAHGDHIYATATVVKRGRQLSLIEVDITDDNGTLCARGRTLYSFRSA